MPFRFLKGVITLVDWVRTLEFWINDWNYEEPDRYYSLKRSQFRQKSLTYWAAKEVVEEVRRHPGENAINVVENFRDRMDDFCCIAKTDEAREIFATLYEVSTNALDFLICLCGN